MIDGQAALLVGAVVGVGVLHTIVPDHWAPIVLIARAQGWSQRETAQAALRAGTGHVVSTLLVGAIVWVAGVAFATKFGNLISTISSLALILFGAWVAGSSLRALRQGDHGHIHAFDFADPLAHAGEPHPHEHAGQPHAHEHAGEPHTHEHAGADEHPHSHPNPEHPHTHPHEVAHRHDAAHAHAAGGGVAVLAKHVHAHRHGQAPSHVHLHDHAPDTWHVVKPELAADPPLHEHAHKRSAQTALLLILGSSPMVEGIPAFFAAGKYGFGLIAVMGFAFGLATVATYVALCVYFTARLQRVTLGSFENYGEVISGAFVAVVGLVFLLFPIL